MHQTESPPTKIYEQDKANDWSESMTRDNYFKLAPKLKLGFAHCGGMLVIGILKKGNSWLFNTNCAQNRLAVNHPTVFYHIGEGSLSHVFVFYTRWQTNTIPFFWEIQSPVEAKYTKRSVPQFPADGGCCFGFAPKFLTELSASKCENRPAQKIDTHRSTLLNFSPSHPTCSVFRISTNCTYDLIRYIMNFCFQHKQESTKKRTGWPRCQSNSVQAS